MYRPIVDLLNEKKVSNQLEHNRNYLFTMIFILEKMLELGIQREPSNDLARAYFNTIRLNIHADHMNRAKGLYREDIGKFYNNHFSRLLRFIKDCVFKGYGQEDGKLNMGLIVNKALYPRIQQLSGNIFNQYKTATNLDSDIDGFFSSSKALYYVREMSRDSVAESWRYRDYENNRDTVEIASKVRDLLHDYCCAKITSKYSYGLDQRDTKIGLQNVIKLLLGLMYNFAFAAHVENPYYDTRSWADTPNHYIYQRIVQSLNGRNPAISGIINNIFFDDPATAIVLSPFNTLSNFKPIHYYRENKSVQDDMNKLLLLCIWYLIYHMQRSSDRSRDDECVAESC